MPLTPPVCARTENWVIRGQHLCPASLLGAQVIPMGHHVAEGPLGAHLIWSTLPQTGSHTDTTVVLHRDGPKDSRGGSGTGRERRRSSGGSAKERKQAVIYFFSHYI